MTRNTHPDRATGPFHSSSTTKSRGNENRYRSVQFVRNPATETWKRCQPCPSPRSQCIRLIWPSSATTFLPETGNDLPSKSMTGGDAPNNPVWSNRRTVLRGGRMLSNHAPKWPRTVFSTRQADCRLANQRRPPRTSKDRVQALVH